MSVVKSGIGTSEWRYLAGFVHLHAGSDPAVKALLPHAVAALDMAATSPNSAVARGAAHAWTVVLQELALPYATRDGYREGWRPPRRPELGPRT